MKRDLNLVREILFCAEKDEPLVTLIEKHGKSIIAGHVAILQDAGFVEAAVASDGKGVPMAAQIIRLTWSGHEFLDNARDNAIWKRVLAIVGKNVASVSLAVLSECLKRAVLQQIGLT